MAHPSSALVQLVTVLGLHPQTGSTEVSKWADIPWEGLSLGPTGPQLQAQDTNI